MSDMLGVFEAFTPKFIKRYAELAKISTDALAAYVRDVKTKAFPGPKHIYPMIPEELSRFREWTASQEARPKAKK